MLRIEALHRHFITRNLTLAAAESCTGGALAHQIPLLPGASRFFLGSAIVSSLTAKQRLLGITATPQTVVTEHTALAMAQAARDCFGADIAVAVTGVAGPTGGTPQTPVGTLCLALATPTTARAWTVQASGSRPVIIQFAVDQLLEALLAE
jgi:nicotinamide-nucleotide amidase